MTLNYTGVVDRAERGQGEEGGGWRIASRICGPAEGVTVIRNEGAGSPPLRPSTLSVPHVALSSHYLALTLLRGNLLINSQLVSAARRLINTRRVARCRHAQYPPSRHTGRRDCACVTLEDLPDGSMPPSSRRIVSARLGSIVIQTVSLRRPGRNHSVPPPKSFAKAFYEWVATPARNASIARAKFCRPCIPSVEIKSDFEFIGVVRTKYLFHRLRNFYCFFFFFSRRKYTACENLGDISK